jgi:hypothetical protein
MALLGKWVDRFWHGRQAKSNPPVPISKNNRMIESGALS